MWLAKTRISHNSSGWPSNQNKKFKGSKVELENLRMELKVMPLQSQTRPRDQRLRGRGGRRKGRGEWRTSPWAQLLAVRGLLVSHLVVTKWELPHTPGSKTLLAQSQYPCGLKSFLGASFYTCNAKQPLFLCRRLKSEWVNLSKAWSADPTVRSTPTDGCGSWVMSDAHAKALP